MNNSENKPEASDKGAWPCLLAKLLGQRAEGYHHDHPSWDFGGLTTTDLKEIERELLEGTR